MGGEFIKRLIHYVRRTWDLQDQSTLPHYNNNILTVKLKGNIDKFVLDLSHLYVIFIVHKSMGDSMRIPTAEQLKQRREDRANFTTANKDIKKAMVKRNIGPYHLEQGYHTNDIFAKSNSGQGIFRFGNRDNWDEIDEGNATFILNAMNSFDALVQLAEQFKATADHKKVKEINKVLKLSHSRVEIRHT